ncbi:hypothetical protein AgCh_016438 [Apium graveolens]
MSSRKGGGSGAKLPTAGSTESAKGKNVAQVSDRWADQVVDRVSAASLDSEQDGGWEEVARKPRNRFVGNVGNQNSSMKVSGNPWTGAKGPSNAWKGAKGPANAWPRTRQPVNAWAGKDSANSFAAPAGDNRRPAGRGWNQSSKEYVNNYDQPAVLPPLTKGWQWRRNPSQVENVYHVPAFNTADATDNKEDEKYIDKSGDEEDFNTEDINDSDEYDSDESQKSHETLKKSTLLKSFFDTLDEMKAEEINEPDRQWHCPACHGGPGAIDWYRGLQPLITHAKTKGKRRAKAHRLLAKLLDEELRGRGSSVIPAGEAFGKWKGLNQSEVRDQKIVWPPMVIITNTQLENDDSGKWIGMGNPELLEYFNNYAAVRSRHSYGPQGHRGMSVLIFEASAVGYFEAERLSKHFEEQGTNREAWDRRQKLFLPGGQRLLYGKSKLKFEMRSYEEMVVNPMKQMNEENHLLHWYKKEAVKEKKHSKTLEESFGALTEKLGKTLEENRIVRQRTKMHHEQIKEEQKDMDNFAEERDKLMKDLEDRKAKLKKQRYEEDVKLEREFDENLAQLMGRGRLVQDVVLGWNQELGEDGMGLRYYI